MVMAELYARFGYALRLKSLLIVSSFPAYLISYIDFLAFPHVSSFRAIARNDFRPLHGGRGRIRNRTPSRAANIQHGRTLGHDSQRRGKRIDARPAAPALRHGCLSFLPLHVDWI